MRKYRRLWEAYRCVRFRPLHTVVGVFGDPKARVIALHRREKTACGVCGRVLRSFYDRKGRRVRDLSCGDMRIALAVEVRRLQCQGCRMVKQERLQWLADNP